MTVVDEDSPAQPFLSEFEGHELKPTRRNWTFTSLMSAVHATLVPADHAHEKSDMEARGILSRMYRYPPPGLKSDRGETAWLDGMRGVAAFLVMIFHYNGGTLGLLAEAPYLAPELYENATTDPMWQIHRLPLIRLLNTSGHAMVSIFFVLSGFVLAWSPLLAMRGWNRGLGISGQPVTLGTFAESLGSLAFRRWLRLFLPCFIVGLVAMVGLYVGAMHMMIAVQPNIFLQLWDYIKSCEHFANPFHLPDQHSETQHRYVMVMWTIPLEWAGSLLVFVTLLGIARIRSYKARAAIVLGISFYSCWSVMWHFWLFSMGLAFADYVQHCNGFDNLNAVTPRSRLVWGGVLMAGVYFCGVPLFSSFYTSTGYLWLKDWTPKEYGFFEAGTRYWWCIGSILLPAGIAHFKTLRCFFEREFPQYLGRISFMLYLIHNITGEWIGGPFLAYTKSVLGEMQYSEFMKADVLVIKGVFLNVLNLLVNLMVLVPVAMFLAVWLEVYVDGPCTRFARWLDRKLTSD